jgi:precorrin-6Y C5,15-methyltransferase (decarboxylating)
VQLAFARLGLSWHDAAVLSAHGRPLDSILPAALFARKLAILTDGRNTPSAVAGALLDAGAAGDTRAHVFEHLGGLHERHVERALGELVGEEFAPLNVLVIPDAGPRQPWRLGLPEEAFAHRRGLITKAELRAVTLSKLHLREDDVLWDIGAGCGSVSIEASGLLRHGQVYAVERDAEQLDYLAENRRRFGAGNLTIVAGEAPSALAPLPLPNAVFIGGSGSALRSIVDVVRDRLAPGGRLVANMVSLEHVHDLMVLARSKGWTGGFGQFSMARSTTTAGLTRLAALNPIFVVTLSPPTRDAR